jgi:hypothetical protein
MKMSASILGGCPYQTDDGFNDRNRFPHGHLFVGEIENGKRYPFGVYTKEESDAKYAVKQTEADLAALAQVVDTKAAQDQVDDLADLVNTKANEAEAEAIRARLDALEYVEMKINTFTASPSVCELGSSNTINLAWSLNKAATQQNINGMAVTGNSKAFASVTTNMTYQLNVTDGQTNASKSVAISFANQIYYGAASDLSSVTSLSKVLSNNTARTITVDAGSGEYIVYAIPARLGDVAFYVGGFEGGFEEPVDQILTNASGYQELYKIYRSTNAGLGETTVEIKEG